ncbi:DUF3084 domain-containing protein [Phormidium tenue FACHB-886]|nr:DUF3084 domain-containing protein [Phormidium tenue FACHB-886]
MTTGLLLIAAVLVLGGVIATVGDRLGTKVGKARLTLFNMRPRRTATLITILTGGIISASTLGVLFAVSDQLRTGVFELEKIQDDLQSAREGLSQANAEQQRTEQRLKRARQQQATAQRRLERINRSLQAAVERQANTEQQLTRTQTQLQQVQSNYQQAQSLLGSVSQQAASLRSEIQQLQSDRQELVRQRDEVRSQIALRDQEIAERDRAISDREAQLQQLETQRTSLSQEIATLEGQYQQLDQEYQDLREGNVAILRNQTLSAGVVRVDDPSAAPQALNRLLQDANQFATQRISPATMGTNDPIVRLPTAEAEQFIDQIEDGKVYVVRVLAAENYVVGEPRVLAGEDGVKVAISAIPNQLIFRQGQAIAASTINPLSIPQSELRARLSVLVQAAQFRARQAGILWETIELPDREQLTAFLSEIEQATQALEIQVIAAEDAYTAGMRLELVAIQAGQVVFSTN